MIQIDYDIDLLGRRIDAARHSLQLAIINQNQWAIRHWGECYSFLLRKWRLLVDGHKNLWDPYKVDKNWIHFDQSSFTASVIDKQIVNIFSKITEQGFDEDLDNFSNLRQYLRPTKNKYY